MLKSSQIDKMSVVERLQAIEQLWDAVCRGAKDMASPEWHRAILTERKERAERGDAKFLTLAQLRTRLRGSEQ
jgi:putative addiction module component (TIGR02574 family)